MKKSTFIATVLGTAGGLMFALGMCMWLVEEWQIDSAVGLIFVGIGAVILLVTLILWWRMEGKKVTRPKVDTKAIGSIILGIVGVLLFGLGMSFALVWESLIIGVILGIVGIVVMLFMIPLTKGLKDNDDTTGVDE